MLLCLDTETKMCSAVFVSNPLAAENVWAGCVGWGNAQIRERDPDRFSATLRTHICFDYLWLLWDFLGLKKDKIQDLLSLA